MEPTNHLATRSRLHGYLERIGSLLTDKRQRASFALYAAGLLNEGERKSMEPLAARASGDPESCSACYAFLVAESVRSCPPSQTRETGHHALCNAA
jgi:SRSO17 transposase